MPLAASKFISELVSNVRLPVVSQRDDAPAVKVKKVSVTSGKALDLIKKEEQSELEEDLSIETEEEIVEEFAESDKESEVVALEDSGEVENTPEDSKKEK